MAAAAVGGGAGGSGTVPAVGQLGEGDVDLSRLGWPFKDWDGNWDLRFQDRGPTEAERAPARLGEAIEGFIATLGGTPIGDDGCFDRNPVLLRNLAEELSVRHIDLSPYHELCVCLFFSGDCDSIDRKQVLRSLGEWLRNGAPALRKGGSDTIVEFLEREFEKELRINRNSFKGLRGCAPGQSGDLPGSALPVARTDVGLLIIRIRYSDCLKWMGSFCCIFQMTRIICALSEKRSSVTLRQMQQIFPDFTQEMMGKYIRDPFDLSFFCMAMERPPVVDVTQEEVLAFLEEMEGNPVWGAIQSEMQKGVKKFQGTPQWDIVAPLLLNQ